MGIMHGGLAGAVTHFCPWQCVGCHSCVSCR